MTAARDLFEVFDIRPGEANLDYDIDATPWLAGTAVLASLELEQDPTDPVTYVSPVALFNGGKLAKLVATCPDGVSLGARFVRVKLTDTQGRVGRQWFQMTVA